MAVAKEIPFSEEYLAYVAGGVEDEYFEDATDDGQTARLDLAVSLLPDREREMIELTVFGRLPVPDAARRLGIARQTAWRARKEGLDKLRILLKDLEP